MEITLLLEYDRREQLRQWLQANHRTARECWVASNRSKQPREGALPYAEVVEEALCFGWIDSTAKRLPDGRLAQRLSPRRKGSHWTDLNRARCRRLMRTGLMTDAGIEALPQEPHIRTATDDDLPQIWRIIEQAKELMREEGRTQWDAAYPTRDIIDADIAAARGYVMDIGLDTVAYFALTFDGEADYNDIDGQWQSNLPYSVVHRMAVAREARRQGLASLLMEHCERLTLQHGFHSIRIDTKYDNRYMIQLIERHGYAYCGKITYMHGGHPTLREAYEKLISKQ